MVEGEDRTVTRAEDIHIHHWVLAPTDGKGIIHGKCKFCGETKEFPASPPLNQSTVSSYLKKEPAPIYAVNNWW